MKSRPSELVAIGDPYVAFCFDEAVSHFGSTIEDAMEHATGKSEALRRGNAENILRKYLGLKPKYRDIRELGKGKKTVANG